MYPVLLTMFVKAYSLNIKAVESKRPSLVFVYTRLSLSITIVKCDVAELPNNEHPIIVECIHQCAKRISNLCKSRI